GGQYLAVAAGKKLDVHRLPDGEIMGEISLSSKDDFASLICRGIAFAPDMSELAAYCESGDASQIACWSLASGEKTVEHTLSRASLVESAAAVAPSASVLDWLPDREGWLVFGCLAIDRKLGKHLVTISRSGPDMVFIGTRVLGRDHLAVIEDKNGARHIRVIPIPREKLAQAREAARVQ